MSVLYWAVVRGRAEASLGVELDVVAWQEQLAATSSMRCWTTHIFSPSA